MGGILSSLRDLEEAYNAIHDANGKNKHSAKDQGRHHQVMTLPQLSGKHPPPMADGDGDGDDDDKAKVGPNRRVTAEMIHRVGKIMLDEHRVPDSFRDAIVNGVLRTNVGGARDDLLSDEDWVAIRSAELRLLFLVAIKSSMSLGRQFNFTASNEYSFVSPQLKQAQLINGGSPFTTGVNTSNTLDTEAKFVAMCAELFGADMDDVDGFVATGSSESNACAVRWASETFPGAPFIGGENMHFSIQRAIQVVGRELLQVEAEKGGEMDMGALGRILARCKDQGVREVCVMLVCGTTMGQAHDNIDAAIEQLDAAGYDREHRYIHVDSAYSGFVLPFLEGVDPGIRVDYRRQGLNSCSASLQKALGVSAPASVFLINKSIAKATFYEYIQTTDITLSCSRNGHAVFEGWAMLTHILGTGRERWSARWQQGVSMAAGFATKLEEAGVADVTHNESSVTVVFPEPSKHLVLRYCLVCQHGRAEVMFNFHNLDGVASNLFLTEYLEWYARRGNSASGEGCR